MAKDHTYFMSAWYFLKTINKLPDSIDKAVKDHLRTIFRIWAQNVIVQHCSELLEAGVMTAF